MTSGAPRRRKSTSAQNRLNSHRLFHIYGLFTDYSDIKRFIFNQIKLYLSFYVNYVLAILILTDLALIYAKHIILDD